MRAFVRLRCMDGDVVELTHGDLIGRLGTAALHFDDARISEAHAMISLRGQELKLLALRGRFSLGSKPMSELVLKAGQTVHFARDLSVFVEEVELPDAVLAVHGDGIPRQILTGAAALFVTEDGLSLEAGYRNGAAALIWNRDDRWRVRIGDGDPQDLLDGSVIDVGGYTLHALGIPLTQLDEGGTLRRGAIGRALRVVTHYDAAQIHREGEPTLVLSGISARILSELVSFGGPVDWPVLAGEVWPHINNRQRLRRNLDVSLTRLRKKLERARIRPDLVYSDGSGKIVLMLMDGDTTDDQG